MAAFFITATGTDIGKTHVACGLIRHLRERGSPIDALKPVVTGYDASRAGKSDPGALLAALGRNISDNAIARMSPWRFAAPLAPDLAARREGRTLDFDALVEHSREAVRECIGTLLIEGVGGVMVPLDGRHTVLDWMAALRLPLVIVAGSYLGSISHMLTCLDVVRRRELSVRVLIINETPGASVSVADTIACVSQFAHDIAICPLQRQDGQADRAGFSKIVQLLE